MNFFERLETAAAAYNNNIVDEIKPIIEHIKNETEDEDQQFCVPGSFEVLEEMIPLQYLDIEDGIWAARFSNGMQLRVDYYRDDDCYEWSVKKENNDY